MIDYSPIYMQQIYYSHKQKVHKQKVIRIPFTSFEIERQKYY